MKNLLRSTLIVCFSFMLLQEAFTQATVADNNPITGRFLGYNGPQNLEFRTNNIPRMMMMQNGNSTINGALVNRSGFLGLSQEPTFFGLGVASPFSLLHLNGDNGTLAPQQFGYRAWMRYGITMTHNQDLMYVRQRSKGTDITYAVIAWID